MFGVQDGTRSFARVPIKAYRPRNSSSLGQSGCRLMCIWRVKEFLCGEKG